MPPKSKQKSLARQLDNATYATLNSRAISDAARALVDDVCARVVEWEEKKSERTYRRDTRAHKFRDAVEAFTADLVRARGNRIARGWVYRSRHAPAFTGQRVSYRSFKSLVDALHGLRLLERKGGFQEKTDFGPGPVVIRAKAARFRATPAFVGLARRHGVEPADVDDHFLEDLPEHPIALRATAIWSFGQKYRGKPMAIPSTPTVLSIESDVRELNEFLRQFKIGNGTHRYYFRGFNNGDDPRFRWNLGGRLYSVGETSYQQLPREQRLAMTINGEPVCEIDISASYLTIFLGWHGKEIAWELIDPYQNLDLKHEDRDAVKQWFVATFGRGDLVTKWSRDALQPFRENTRKDLRKFSATRIRDAALQAYPQLKRWPTDRRTWADLMWVESQAVIAAMLSLKREHSVPSLAVHDSLIVALAQRELGQRCLHSCYKKATGVIPMIRTRAAQGYL